MSTRIRYDGITNRFRDLTTNVEFYVSYVEDHTIRILPVYSTISSVTRMVVDSFLPTSNFKSTIYGHYNIAFTEPLSRISFVFNGVELMATPNSDIDTLYRNYQEGLARAY